MQIPRSLITLTLTCSAVSGSYGNDKLEQLIVTSSRTEMPVRQIGTSVSIVTAQDIEARGFSSMYEILRSQPGVAASNSGGMGQTTAVRIRGEESYRTRAFIDGLDVSDNSGPQSSARFEEILAAGIHRVEILRGPQGLLYGADAGGVINMFTRSAEPGLAGSISAESGRYGSNQLAADIGAGNELVDFSLLAADFHTDGFNARSDDTVLRDEDGYDNTTLHGRVGINARDDLRLELIVRDIQSESEFDNCNSVIDFSRLDACHNEFDQQAWRAVVDYAGDRFAHQLAYTGSDTRRGSYAARALSFGAEGQSKKMSYLGNFNSGTAMGWVYGVDLLTESLDDGTFDRNRDQNAVFLEYQGNFGDQLFVTAGARHDDNDDFGSHATFRLSGAYLLQLALGELKFRGTYGTGFRAPSLYEIAYNDTFASSPAAEVSLTEEHSAGFDVGLAWYADSGFYLEANYFQQTISDEIYFDLNAYSGYLQDQGDSDSRGVELMLEAPLSAALTLTGNYTYNTTDGAIGSTRPRRPQQLASVGVNWHGRDDRLTLGVNVRGVWDARDIDDSALDDYQLIDINARYELIDGLQLYARVENLLDDNYREVPLYNTAGAAAYAGVRYSF